MHASLRGFRAIIFDCDGVLLDSNQIKTDAFARLFAADPDHLPAILAYHVRYLGVSRYEKIRHIHHAILHRPLTDADLEALGARFGALVHDELMRCAEVSGARQFLAEARGCQQRLFVASGAPEEELKTVLRGRDLDQFFEAIHGSPRSKAEIVRSILRDTGTAVDQAVLIGDAITDQEAARSAGIAFVAIGHDPGDQLPRSSAGMPEVRTLRELL